MSSRDRTAVALSKINHAITDPCPHSPFLNGEQTQETVNELSDVFNTQEQPPRLVPLRTRASTKSAQPSPRVARPITSKLPFPNGTVITKVFYKTVHKGNVIHHDACRKLFEIVYSNGNSEEMSHNKVAKELHLEKQRTSKPTQLPTHNKNWTAQNSGRRRSPCITKLHSVGFCNATNNLSSNWHDDGADIRQVCKHANLIIDKETDKQLECQQLMKHPRLQNAWLCAAGNELGRLFRGIKNKNVIK